VAAVDIKTLYTIKKRGKSRENNDLMTKITKNKAKKKKKHTHELQK
jgi:hypothetical protein